MKYISTRDQYAASVDSAQAILEGLAPDGGLFVPEKIPAVDADFIASLLPLSYSERAVRILSLFLDDYTENELRAYCEEAYCEASFPGEEGPAPVRRVRDNVYALELWHGPTCAFKDMALQLMPRLMSGALKKVGETKTALVLVATSGDTGKAALEGYKDVDQIKIMVFYPVDGVSRVQKLQMITQTGSNVEVRAIRGNFDDAQNGVKRIFSDIRTAEALAEKGYFLSSANSINWGRLVPQVVYYFSAYCDLVNQGAISVGDRIDFCVPTGNFGNIFAAYTAKLMGLPVEKLICASNSNNVLTDFFTTGTYDRNREFHTTMSPSMDILISSNLERLLYFAAGIDKIAGRDGYMAQLAENGRYTVDETVMEKIRETFVGKYADEDSTEEAIRRTYDNYGYLCDTHTAVGISCLDKYLEETGSDRPVVVASTASPFKFAASVYRALTGCIPPEDTAALDALAKATDTRIPEPLAGLNSRRIRFDTVCRPGDMLSEVLGSLE